MSDPAMPPGFKDATRDLWEACSQCDDPKHASDAVINWVLKLFLPSSRWVEGLIAYCVDTGKPNYEVTVAKVDAAMLFELIGIVPDEHPN